MTDVLAMMTDDELRVTLSMIGYKIDRLPFGNDEEYERLNRIWVTVNKYLEGVKMPIEYLQPVV